MRPIIDAHAHIYPDAIAEHAAKSIGDFYNYNGMFYDGRLTTLLAAMRASGVARAIVSSVATTPHQISSINHFLADAVRQRPEHISALGTMHPSSPDPEADFAQIQALGLHGVKLHPDFLQTPMDSPGFYRIYELCEGKLPICCHLGDHRYDFTNPNRTARVLADFPNLTFIGAHMGGYTVWEQVEVARLYAYENLTVDCSSTLHLLPPETSLRMIREFGADRVCFGTDFPMWESQPEIDALLSLGLTDGELDAILHKTAERVYGVPSGKAWESEISI